MVNFLSLEVIYDANYSYAMQELSLQLEQFEIVDFQIIEPMKKNPLDYYKDEKLILNDYFAIKIFLEDCEENEKRIENIEKTLKNMPYVENFVHGYVDESSWKDTWKAYFKPTKIGQSIVVKPKWEPYVANTDEKMIVIDPKMAFGTGTHATTAHCLRFIEKYMKEGSSVLDLGTGSGILLIASKLFGAGSVCGIDIDEEALDSARENLALNGIKGVTVEKNIDALSETEFDTVIANIITEVLIELFESMVTALKPNGLLMLSGILIEKQHKIETEISKYGLVIVEKAEEDDWTGYVCKKIN